MSEQSFLYTREAAEISGFSPRHIQSLIKKGKLSARKDDAGSYIIDKCEFYRVFPDTHTERTVANRSDDTSRTVSEMEIVHLKEMLSEKTRQIEFLHRQLETAESQNSALIETISGTQRLLEHSRKKRKKFLGIF